METPNKNKSRVRVHGTLTVVSSTPVEPGRYLKLTPLDHAMAHHTGRIVYYYGRADRADPSMEFDRLRMSLCELLCMYPTLTGRLARDDVGNWVVMFTDAGVRVKRSDVGATLEEWLRSADGDEEKELTAWDEFPDDPHIWPPFRVQLNEFECGGIAIGLSFSHLLSDPTTATFFFHSWSQSHLRQPLSHPPSFTRPTPPSPASTNTLSSYYATTSSNSSSPTTNTATATFSFSDASIKQLLSNTSPEATPFDLLAALFWSRIVGDNYAACHTLSICVDFRTRLHVPLPHGYFGNALHFTRLAWEGGDVGSVAEVIHRHVVGVREEEVWSTVEWLESRKDEKGKFGEPFGMYGPELTCVNMEHLVECGSVMYASEFGDGRRPVHVSYDVEEVGGCGGEGLIWVMPSPEGGMARRVKVVLPAELVERLSDDEAIRSLAPTTLISGGLVARGD